MPQEQHLGCVLWHQHAHMMCTHIHTCLHTYKILNTRNHNLNPAVKTCSEIKGGWPSGGWLLPHPKCPFKERQEGKNKHVLVVQEWFTRRRSLFLLVPKWGGWGLGVGVGAGTESSKRCLLKKERREESKGVGRERKKESREREGREC